jgi:hypothetical protein
MTSLKKLTVEADLGTSEEGNAARASLYDTSLHIVIYKGDSIQTCVVDFQQAQALKRILDTHYYGKI